MSLFEGNNSGVESSAGYCVVFGCKLKMTSKLVPRCALGRSCVVTVLENGGMISSSEVVEIAVSLTTTKASAPVETLPRHLDFACS
jgi:dUTPase